MVITIGNGSSPIYHVLCSIYQWKKSKSFTIFYIKK